MPLSISVTRKIKLICFIGLAVLLIASLITWISSVPTDNTGPVPPAEPVTETVATDTISEQAFLEGLSPVRLTISSINLDTTFTDSVGINDDGSVEVPQTYDQVGLYKYGPAPGQRGPAVILGHVDSFEGPAVFYNLKKVSLGDEVFIERDNGTTAVFTITETESLKQSKFPTEKVYNNLDYAGLRLITCTGFFSQAKQRYSHNLIIYAELTRFE